MAHKLWTKGGKLIVEDGKAILCDCCPCVEAAWYCLCDPQYTGTGTEDTGTGTLCASENRICVCLNAWELEYYLTLGYSIHSGPHATEEECLEYCVGTGSDTGTGTGTDETGTGTATSTIGTGTGTTITNDCCDTNSVLTATLTPADACTACGFPSTIELTYDSGSGTWVGGGTDDGSCAEIYLTLECDGGSWLLNVGDIAGLNEETSTEEDCNPLSIVFDFTLDEGVGDACTGSLNITITE